MQCLNEDKAFIQGDAAASVFGFKAITAQFAACNF